MARTQRRGATPDVDRINAVLKAWNDPAKSIDAALKANEDILKNYRQKEPVDALVQVLLVGLTRHLAIAPRSATTKVDKKYVNICAPCDEGTPDACCGPDVGVATARQRLIKPQAYIIDPNDYLEILCCLLTERYRPAKEQLDQAQADLDELTKRIADLTADLAKRLEDPLAGYRSDIAAEIDCKDYKPKNGNGGCGDDDAKSAALIPESGGFTCPNICIPASTSRKSSADHVRSKVSRPARRLSWARPSAGRSSRAWSPATRISATGSATFMPGTSSCRTRSAASSRMAANASTFAASLGRLRPRHRRRSAKNSASKRLARAIGQTHWVNVMNSTTEAPTQAGKLSPIGFGFNRLLGASNKPFDVFDPFIEANDALTPRPTQVEDFDDLVTDENSPDFYGKRVPFVDKEKGPTNQGPDSSGLITLVRDRDTAPMPCHRREQGSDQEWSRITSRR